MEAGLLSEGPAALVIGHHELELGDARLLEERGRLVVVRHFQPDLLLRSNDRVPELLLLQLSLNLLDALGGACFDLLDLLAKLLVLPLEVADRVFFEGRWLRLVGLLLGLLAALAKLLDKLRDALQLLSRLPPQLALFLERLLHVLVLL